VACGFVSAKTFHPIWQFSQFILRVGKSWCITLSGNGATTQIYLPRKMENNGKIKHRETLVYYDGPQLFLARDQVNAQYLCLLVDDSNEFSKFLCVLISSARLDDFYRKEIDLRKIYENPENGEWFYAEITENIQRDYQLVPVSFDNLPKEWLPESGFILKPKIAKQKLHFYHG
jgi:hypothetical protein